MDIQKNSFLSIDQLADQYLSRQPKVKEAVTEAVPSFKEVLQNKTFKQGLSFETTADLKFSKHAAGRLAERNIELSTEQLERLQGGARKAEQKGIKDSLVIVDELAFIVNIPNQTVITAMDSTETNENVFTNINGAVIM
ncbi:MAG: flagellar protein [Lachnospiraceae bacterium]|nr:flagellar protein [Lachnospiraceae bacterium]